MDSRKKLRDFSKLLRSSLQELFRCNANDTLEISGKVTLIAKTYPDSNVCNAEFAVLQKIFCFIDSTLQNVLVGRYTHTLLEQTQKVILTHLGDQS